VIKRSLPAFQHSLGTVILEFDNNPVGSKQSSLPFVDFLQRELAGFCRRLLFPAFTTTLAMLDANPVR